MTIDRAAARRVVGEMAEELGRTIEQTAEAIIRIAVSGMYSGRQRAGLAFGH